MYFYTVISMVVNKKWRHIAAIASEVIASLVSKYEKAHPREKWRIVCGNFSYFCRLSFMSYGWQKKRKKKRKKERKKERKKKNDEMDIFVAEFLTSQKVKWTSRVVSQYTSEADLSE